MRSVRDLLLSWASRSGGDIVAPSEQSGPITSSSSSLRADPTQSLLERLRRSPVHPVFDGDALLALLPNWAETRDAIFKCSQLRAEHFEALYMVPIRRFAERVQFLPASESHHHSYPLGQLEHTLDVVLRALRRRQAILLPLGAEPERESRERPLWTYAVFLAALNHDIGKPIARFSIKARTKSGDWSVYRPAGKSLVDFGAVEYQASWNSSNEYEYHHRVALSMFGKIVPDAGVAWLSGCAQAFAQVMAYLYGDRYNCGTVGQIVYAADGSSTAVNIGAKLPSGMAVGGDQVVPIYKRAELALREMARDWTLNGKSKAGGNVKGSDAWIIGNYIFTRSNIINDVYDRLAAANPTGTPEAATLMTKMSDMGLCLSYEAQGGQSRSVFYVDIADPSGGSIAKNFSVLIFPLDRLYALDQRPGAFEGRIEVVKPQLPVGHVLASAASVSPATVDVTLGNASPNVPDGTPAHHELDDVAQPALAADHAPISPAVSDADDATAWPSKDWLSSRKLTPTQFFDALASEASPSDEPAVAVTKVIAADPPVKVAEDHAESIAAPTVSSTPAPTGGPTRLNDIGDYLPSDHHDVDPPIVRAFFDWIRAGLMAPVAEEGARHQLSMNCSGALLHGVPDMQGCIGLVSPKAFGDFLASTEYQFGPDEYTTADGDHCEGLRAEIHQMQSLFRGSKWAVHNGQEPGKNIFAYSIQAGQPQTLSLSVVVATPEAASLMLPTGMRVEANSALVRMSSEELQQRRREKKTNKGGTEPTPSVASPSQKKTQKDRKPKEDQRVKFKLGNPLDDL